MIDRDEGRLRIGAMLHEIRKDDSDREKASVEVGVQKADEIIRSSQFSPLIATFDRMEETLKKGA